MNDSKSSMPLYYQIVSDMKRKIEEGILAPGDKLPTEYTLSKTYDVSRVTVRNALKALSETKLVEHQVNKGYFVAKFGKTETVEKGYSLHDDLTRLGLTPYSKIVSMTTEKCDSRLCSIFDCSPDDAVIVLKRIRYVNNKPFAEEMNYLPFAIFEGIDLCEIENGSLIRVMEEQFGVRVAYTEQNLKPKFPTQEQRQLLGLSSNNPQLAIRSKVVDVNGRVLKYAKVFFRTDVVEYSFTWTL